MAIVTLTTDLGYRDPYLGIVKARLLSSIPQLQLVDLSCEVKENNIAAAAFILKNSIRYFPEETIHLVAVKGVVDRSQADRSGTADNSRFLIARYKNQFVVTPDTGLFTLLEPDFAEEVYQIYYDDKIKRHFFLKDIFVEVASQLVSKNSMSDIGSQTNEFYKAFQFEPYVQGNMLRGKGVYVDDFGNIITNITRKLFQEVVGNKAFTITLPGAHLTRIYESYDEVKYGSPLVFFNSMDFLEVAANGKSAFNLLCPRDIGSGFDFNLLIEFQ